MELGMMVLKVLSISYVWSSKDDEEFEPAMVLVFFMMLCGMELTFSSCSSMTAFLFSLSMIGGLCVLILFIIKLTSPYRETKSNSFGSKVLMIILLPLSSLMVLFTNNKLETSWENFEYKSLLSSSSWSSESPLLMSEGISSLLFVVSLLMMMLFIVEYSTSHKMPLQWT